MVLISVLVAIAVKPKDGLKPYLLMGSDSKEVLIEAVPLVSGELDFKISTNENKEKIFRVNDILVGMTGKHDDTLMVSFIEHLRENDMEFEKLSYLSFDYIKKYVENENRYDALCAVTMGCCKNSKPILTRFTVDKTKLTDANIRIIEPPDNNCIPSYSGKSVGLDDLREKFEKGVRDSININLVAVKKTATEYLKAAAARYPETCNQNIRIMYLK